MIGPAMDRGGLQHSKNAPNSIFSKINRTGFWRFGTDMTKMLNFNSENFDLQPWMAAFQGQWGKKSNFRWAVTCQYFFQIF